jgi:hypothetical protein
MNRDFALALSPNSSHASVFDRTPEGMAGIMLSNGALLMSWGGLGGSKLYSFSTSETNIRGLCGSAPIKIKVSRISKIKHNTQIFFF